jgi:hypothetical protein
MGGGPPPGLGGPPGGPSFSPGMGGPGDGQPQGQSQSAIVKRIGSHDVWTFLKNSLKNKASGQRSKNSLE